jgi:hypothetical protein
LGAPSALAVCPSPRYSPCHCSANRRVSSTTRSTYGWILLFLALSAPCGGSFGADRPCLAVFRPSRKRQAADRPSEPLALSAGSSASPGLRVQGI